MTPIKESKKISMALKYPEDYLNKVIQGDCFEVMKQMPDKCVDLVIVDPPYQEGYKSIFPELKRVLKENGQIIYFVQPTELYDLPEKPKQVLVWEEPISPKPIYKKYREFLDFIAWYAYGEYTFNKIMWNMMNSRFNDEIIRKERLHKWEKPITLIQKLLLIHSDENDIVLDPFIGSGTTAVAAKQLKRNFIGIEISPEYCEIANKRLAQNILI